MHLVKRERIEDEDETKNIVEGSNKGGIASVNDNYGENMELDNACVLNECHLRTNNILWKRLCVFHQRMINIICEL